MKPILCCLGTTLALIFSAATAPAQSIPVPENLWRLVAQEDTDGDQKITVHDRTTPFEIRDENGADVRAVTNEYQLSVLMQELKHADDQHTGNHRHGQSTTQRKHRGPHPPVHQG